MTNETQSGAKFTISAIVEGFPVQVEVEGNAEKLFGIIERLRQIGAVAPQETQVEERQTPRCIYHHSEMRAGKRPGSWFCPKKNKETGEFCDYKV